MITKQAERSEKKKQMAPFKFGKKHSKEKHRQSPTQTVAQSSPTVTPPPPPSSHPRPPVSRVYPTPPPQAQRNVSGSSTLQPAVYSPWNRIKLGSSPFPRYRHVASAYASEQNQVFVIGGLHDQSVYGDTWILTAHANNTRFTSKTVDISDTTPPPRVGHASTLCGNAFVIFGGDTHKVNNEGLMDDDVYLFNINSYKWTIPHPVGPRPLGRYGHKISVIATSQMKTKLYVFGGQFDDTYFNDLCVYDLSSFRRPDSHWEFLKPQSFVPPPLTNHTMVSYDYKLWIFGGDTAQGLINEVFMYDPTVNDWTVVETTGSKPPAIQEHAAVVYKDLMCVTGGKDEQDSYSNDVYFLNLKSFKWFKLPFFKNGVPQGRSGHSLTLLSNNSLLVMGGDKFDYASIGEHDLHTSERDQGCGTILYTLDLTKLEEFCPGIFDVTKESPRKSSDTTPLSSPTQKKAQPRHPQQQQSQEQQQSQQYRNYPQQNILTPYSEKYQTPQNDQHAFVASSTPQNTKRPVSSVPQIEAHQKKYESPPPRISSLSPINDPTRDTADKINNASMSEYSDEYTGQLETATVVNSPTKKEVKKEDLNSSPDVPLEELVESTIPGGFIQEKLVANKAEDIIGEIEPALATKVATLPKVSEENSVAPVTTLETDNQMMAKKAVELPEKESLSKEILPLKESAQEAPLVGLAKAVEIKPHTEDNSRPVPMKSVTATSSNSVLLSRNDSKSATVQDLKMTRSTLANLSKELQQLKFDTEQRAIQASERIKQLELENESLKESKGNIGDRSAIVKLRNDYDIANADISSYKERISELEDVLQSKFLDAGHLNDIIKQQSSHIEELEKEETYKEKCFDLEQKYELLLKENETLKNAEKEHDVSLHTSVKEYSALLDEYLTKLNTTSTEPADNTGVARTGPLSEHHQHVLAKLTSQIDQLLSENKELVSSKEELFNSYQKLEDKHRDLDSQLSARQNELTRIEENYKSSLSSVNSASKALNYSQQELEKLKRENKSLAEELEELKYSRNNIGEPNNAGETTVNSFDESMGSANATGSSVHDDIRDAHYNLKIKDLKAELFIIKQERDSLKDDVLQLKKKLLNLEE